MAEWVMRHGRLIAYIIPWLVAAAFMQSWFIPGTVIAYGDIPPPIAPTPDYISHWNEAFSGEGTPSYEIVQLPYYEAMRAASALGLHQGTFQRIWLTLLVSGAAVSAVFLAFAFTTSRLAAGTAGVLAVLNPFMLVNGANGVPLATMVVGCVLAGLLARAALRPTQGPRAISFALMTLGLSYTFVNPPHLLLVFMLLAAIMIVASAAGGKAAALRGAGYLARATPIALVLNVWWIVPSVLTITSEDFGRRFAALDVASWEWTHVRSSFFNALTLNTTWGWTHPEYFPFADRLEQLPFAPLKLCLPVLALAGVLLARGRERRIALALAGIALLLIWVAKGLHPPFREASAWLYAHVPLYWLLREPSKALLLLAIVFSLLGGLATHRLAQLRRRRLGITSAAALVAGAVLWVHPLITGEVVTDNRPLLPGNHVTVPAAWTQLGTFLNARSREGKVAILPTQDFYQLPTTWGYYGVSFSRYVVGRGVFEAGRDPGSYFRPAPGVSSTLSSIEDDLLEGDSSAVVTKLRVLGAKYLLIRHDLAAGFPNRRFAEPKTLERGVSRVPNLRRIREFGLFSLYEVLGPFAGEVFAASATPYAGPHEWIPSALELRPNSALVTRDADRAGLVDAASPMRVFRSQRGLLRVEARTDSSGLAVRLSDPMRVELSGRRLARLKPQILLFRDLQTPALLTIGARWFRVPTNLPVWTDLGFAAVPAALAVRLWHPGERVYHPLTKSPRVLDCERDPARNRSLAQLRISGRTFTSRGSRALRLRALGHSACVVFRLPKSLATVPVLVRFDYRGVRGEPPRFCAWQDGPGRCADAPPLTTSPGWHQFEGPIVPELDNLGLSLFLYGDGGHFAHTAADYRGIAYRPYRLRAVRRFRVPDLAQVGQATFATGTKPLSLATQVPKAPTFELTRPGALRDCYRSDARTPREAGLALAVIPTRRAPILRLSATAHSACTIFPIEPFDPAARYRVRLEYRGVEGHPPRICVWMVGSNRCALHEPLQHTLAWRRFVATVTPDPGTVGMQLFLYADGHKKGLRKTVTEYRSLSVVPLTPVALLGRSQGSRLPRVSYTRSSPSEFSVRVDGARERFLLVLDESYSSGWRLRATDRRPSNLRHVMVNGYANGWVVPWVGTYDLRIHYEPERLARIARILDAGLIPFAFLIWAGRLDVRLARRLRRRPAGIEPAGDRTS